MRLHNRLPPTLWLILAVALALRLLGAWCANLTFDERAHVALADTIDLRPGHLHLVTRTVSHPLLAVYVMKLSGLLFGTSDFGLRLLHSLAGALTVVPIYFLGRRAFGAKAGLWAAALLAVDQFHASWSRVLLHEGLMLLFASLFLLQLLRLLEKGTTRGFVLLGTLLGLAYLAKEAALLLIPVVWIYLLISPEHRALLRRPQWYLAHVVFLAVVSVDVWANIVGASESYLARDLSFVTEPFQLSMKSLSLYVGELFRSFVGLDVLDVEYEQGHVYTCFWPAGVFYLVAVAAAVRCWNDGPVRLMLVTFGFVFGLFFVMPGGGPYEPFWWASISLIPAVICAGWILGAVADRGKAATAAAMLIVACLGIHYVPIARRAGPDLPRATMQEFVDDFLTRAAVAMQQGNHAEARDRFIFVLNMGGPHEEAYYGLGLVALQEGRPEIAAPLLRKCLGMAPNHQRAQRWLESIERRANANETRQMPTNGQLP